MARHLSVATVIEKNRVHSAVAFVALMRINVIDPDTGEHVEYLHMARNDEDVVYQGVTYVAASFDLNVDQEAGTVPKVSVSAVDYTRTIQARMQEYAGGVGFEVEMMIVNTDNLEQPPEVAETFRVISASSSDYIVSFTLGAENPLALRFPFYSQHRDRCRWRYKDAQCGYSGGMESCDLSLQGPNGCAAHGNERRFGGFPGLAYQG